MGLVGGAIVVAGLDAVEPSGGAPPAPGGLLAPQHHHLVALRRDPGSFEIPRRELASGVVDGGVATYRPQAQQSTTVGRPAVPERASRTFDAARVPELSMAAGATLYAVQVERGLPTSAQKFARVVDSVLGDTRGWASRGHVLRRSTLDRAAFRVVLASPKTADELCAPLDTDGRLSCRVGERAVINAWRWWNGAQGYDRLERYRTYVVNHEVGHALGYAHAGCTGIADVAPVMLQQTIGLDGCRPNPWPAWERRAAAP